MRRLRSTGTRSGPSERQPSSSLAVSSERSTISGLTSALGLGVLAIGVVHEHAPQQADLVAGEADAVGVVHQP